MPAAGTGGLRIAPNRGLNPWLQGITRLEAEMQHLRNLLNNTTALATSLKELAGAPAKAAG